MGAHRAAFATLRARMRAERRMVACHAVPMPVLLRRVELYHEANTLIARLEAHLTDLEDAASERYQEGWS